MYMLESHPVKGNSYPLSARVDNQLGRDLDTPSILAQDFKMVTSFIDGDGMVCLLDIFSLNVYKGHEVWENENTL